MYLRNLLLLVTTAHGVMAMDPQPGFSDLNPMANRLTEQMAMHAFTQNPDQNTLVSAVGPLHQVLSTYQYLSPCDEPTSPESLIKGEIEKGLGLSSSCNVEKVLQQFNSLPRSAVKQANVLMVPHGNEVSNDAEKEVISKHGVEVMKFDRTSPQETAQSVNTWALTKTQGSIPHLAEPSHFIATTEYVLLNSLFTASEWTESFHETTLKFHSKGEVKPVKGFKDTQQAYVYKSYHSKSFTIVNLVAQNDLYLAIKMYDDGSVSPITVEEFNKPATSFQVDLTVPSFKFTQGLDLHFLKQTFPTLFSSEFQTTLTPHRAAIGTFKQENFIDVNEAGFKAGSATIQTSYSLGIAPTPNKTIEINKPFSFLIFMKTKGSQSKGENFLHLFSGTVVDLPGLTSEEDYLTYMEQLSWKKEALKENQRRLEAQIQKLKDQIAETEADYESATKIWEEKSQNK